MNTMQAHASRNKHDAETQLGDDRSIMAASAQTQRDS